MGKVELPYCKECRIHAESCGECARVWEGHVLHSHGVYHHGYAWYVSLHGQFITTFRKTFEETSLETPDFMGTIEYDDKHGCAIASLYEGSACVWVNHVPGDKNPAIFKAMKRLHDAYSTARV